MLGKNLNLRHQMNNLANWRIHADQSFQVEVVHDDRK